MTSRTSGKRASAEDELNEFISGGPSGPRVLVRFLKEQLPAQIIWLIPAILCMLAVAGLTTCIAWLMEPAFDEVFSGEDQSRLLLVGLAFPCVFLARGLASYISRFLMAKVGLDVVARTRRRLYDHVQSMDVAFFAKYRTASLINRLIGDTTKLRNVLIQATTTIVREVTTAAGLLASLFVFDFDLAMLAMIVFPLAIVPVYILGRMARNVARLSTVESGLFAGTLLQAFQNMRLVKVYGAEDFERERVGHRADRLYRLSLRQERIVGGLDVAMATIIGIAFAVIITYGVYRMSAGTLSDGTLVAFLTAVMLAYQPLKKIGRLNVGAQELFVTLRRYYGLLDLKPDISEDAGAPDLDVPRGCVALEDVTLTYPGSDQPALHDLTISFPAGKTSALVGPSGAGKSSVFSLLVRFLDPDVGRITIDGRDISGVALRSLWRQVTLVSQDVIVFDDTIRANIAFGRPHVPLIDIETAARGAALEDFIATLPDGLDTFVGEDGARLSGGQRQRLSIARAMLKDAPILLLDEATSALDPENERKVRVAFDTVRKNRTCVVIAHRMSTIRNADVIFVMDNGRLVDSGAHADLIERCSLYASLCAGELNQAPSSFDSSSCA